ncbi:MAG TPA: hypothetical protein VFC98_00895 [Clostridia bacterium]|nr:hypothetical protein [Clostridia bacterium]
MPEKNTVNKKEALTKLIEGLPIIFDSDFIRIANNLRFACDLYTPMEQRLKCYQKIEEFKDYINSEGMK